MTSTPLSCISPCATLDTIVLEELYGLLGDRVREVFEIYLEETPKLLAEMRGALASGELTTVQALAHRLRGSSAACGALMFAKLCMNLEQAATRQKAHLWLRCVEMQYERVERELRQDRLHPTTSA